MKKIVLTLSLLTIVLFYSLPIKAQTTNHQVYSLFVMNIAKYSVWPPSGTEFHITVFGRSKVFDELMKLSATKTINGMVMKVRQTENINDLGQQHIIYLSENKSALLDEILKATQGKSIMVITEREGLFKKGAGFSFVVLDDNTLRFDINNTDLEKRQIKVSKNLTNLANSMM